jgi:hypothetical protein
MTATLTRSQVDEMAKEWATLARSALKLRSAIADAVKKNEALSVPWTGWTLPTDEVPEPANPKPDCIQLDALGNIQGMHGTPSDYANLIYSLQQIQAVLDGGVPAQGNHGGNLYKVI